MSALSDPIRFRRGATAACLIAAGVMILAGVLISPDQGDGTTTSYLASLAEEPGATQLSAVLLHFGFLLLVPAAFGLLTLLRVRAVALGHVAILLAVLGGVSIAGNVVTDFYDLALAQNLASADATRASDAAEQYGAAAALIVPGFLGSLLGFTLLAVAVWRAGWVPVGLPVLMGAAWVAFFAFTPIGAAGLLGALSILARRVAKMTDHEWQAGAPAQEQSAVVLPVGTPTIAGREA